MNNINITESIDIARLVPRFLMNDQDGRAMAKAIEAGLKYFTARVEQGIACVTDVSQMPEWRLDEMAWELGCLYDYSATLDDKRAWIQNAHELSKHAGTPAGLRAYLTAKLSDAVFYESWQYGGQPYHYMLALTGEWSEETQAWAQAAVQKAQNVRSVLDVMGVASMEDIYVIHESSEALPIYSEHAASDLHPGVL